MKPFIAIGAAILAACHAVAFAQPSATQRSSSTSSPTYPSYSVTRWSEDYSYLKDPSKRTDPLDAIKYIPLGADDFYLSLGGTARERYEYYNNLGFGASAQDNDGYFLTRFMAHADLHLGQFVRIFAEGKEVFENGREPGPRASDQDEWDLQQLFIDLKAPVTDALSLTLRLGRQDLAYGSRRIVDPADWGNARRTFEGVKLITDYKATDWSNSAEVFLTRPVVVNAERFNEGDDTQTFWGLYDTVSLPWLGKSASTKLDGYLLVLNQQESPSRTADADIYTVGTRLCSKPKPWDFDVETAYQSGTQGRSDIAAYFLYAEGGFTFSGVQLTPRPFVALDVASGDGNPTDGTRSTYNSLFCASHSCLGYADLVGRRNIFSPTLGTDLTFFDNKAAARKLSLRAQYLAFWKMESADSLYNTSGTAISRPETSDDTFIGQEVDLLLNWQINRHLLTYVGYSHFFAGDVLHSTAGGNGAIDNDVDFFYVAAQFTF